MPNDTHPEAKLRQVELMRRAGVARRFAAVRSLTRTVAALSRRALQRRHPQATQAELGVDYLRRWAAELALEELLDRALREC